MLVQGRRTHRGVTGDRLDVEGLAVALLQESDGAGDLRGGAAAQGVLAQDVATGTAENLVEDLAQKALGQHLAIHRVVEAIHQPAQGAGEGGAHRAGAHRLARWIPRPVDEVVDLGEELGDKDRIEADDKAEEGLFGRGGGDLGLDRQGEGADQVVPGIVGDRALADPQALGALGDHADRGLVDDRHRLGGRGGLAVETKLRDGGVAEALVGSMAEGLVDELDACHGQIMPEISAGGP